MRSAKIAVCETVARHSSALFRKRDLDDAGIARM